MKYDVFLYCKPEILEEEVLNDPDQEFYASKDEKTGLIKVLACDVPEEVVVDYYGCLVREEAFCNHYGIKPGLIEKIEVPDLDDEEDESDDEYAPQFY